MRSNAGTHGSRAEYGNFLDSLQQRFLRVETNDCMKWDAGNRRKSSNSEKKMMTGDAETGDRNFKLNFRSGE
jgi:hypothetical protein